MLDFIVESNWRSTLKRDGGTHCPQCACQRCAAWLRFSLGCGSVDFVGRPENRRRLKQDTQLAAEVDVAAARLMLDMLQTGEEMTSDRHNVKRRQKQLKTLRRECANALKQLRTLPPEGSPK